MSNSTQGTTVAFTYDAWGRMVTKTQGDHLAAYRFRFGDKMTQIDSNFPDEAASVVIMYDGLGKRRYKFVSGTPNSTTYWWRWGAGWNVVNEYTDVESTWDWDPESLTATYVGSMAEITGADPSSGAYRYYSGDNLGSVRRVRAQDKSSLAQYEYTPYGAAYSQSGLALNRGFTGHKWDSEIAMYWAPYRHYLPAQARWTTSAASGTANSYSAAANNPVITGCSSEQKEKIRADFKKFCDKVNSPGYCSCMGDDKALGDKIKEKCSQPLTITCLSSGDSPCNQSGPNRKVCGNADLGGNVIRLCPDAFEVTPPTASGGCGDVGCTLLHELAHTTGEEGEAKAEKAAKCAGCK